MLLPIARTDARSPLQRDVTFWRRVNPFAEARRHSYPLQGRSAN
jgi:hypothetical protein